MSGKHIKKVDDGKWEYPNHEELLKICKLYPIERYIERRRGTIRKYLEEHRRDLLNSVQRVTPPSQQSNKVLRHGPRKMRKGQEKEKM